MLIFSKFNFKAQYTQDTKQHFILRSACESLSMMTNPKRAYKVSVANAFNHVFARLATTSDYAKFFSILNAFTNDTHTKGLERFLPHFVGLQLNGFDLESWLNSVNTHLFQVLVNANIIDDENQTKQKEIYLQLTSTLLFLVNAELQRTVSMKKPWQFSECQRFLKNCIELFRNSEERFTLSFQFLSKFLDCVCAKIELDDNFYHQLNYLFMNSDE